MIFNLLFFPSSLLDDGITFQTTTMMSFSFFFVARPLKNPKWQEARNEKLHTPLNIDQALDARDAIAKALYRYKKTSLEWEISWFQPRYDRLLFTDRNQRRLCVLYSSLFGWLVNRVNSIVNKGERPMSINILDIFGFEDFPVRDLFWLAPLN